jgi:hypothetical protein
MMNQILPSYYFPNKMGRILLMAMEEVLGSAGINDALTLANLPHRVGHYPPNNLDKQFSCDELSSTQAALERLYGNSCGRGLALRSGRVYFTYGLREFGPTLGCNGLDFRLLPLRSKIQIGIGIFAAAVNQLGELQVDVTEDNQHFYWSIHRCPVCWNRRSDVPTCHLAVGAIQESLTWLSGGKHYQVEETECAASGGSACVIQIEKQALD